MPSALVTGGNRGIGQQICRELASTGWSVIVAGRDLKKANTTAARLKKEISGRLRGLELDVTSDASVADAHRRLRDGAIKLDALVNNAGVYREDDAATIVETNFFGPLRVVDGLKDLLLPGARIVNVTSGLGALANLTPQKQALLADPTLTRERLVALMREFVASGGDWGTDPYGVSKAALNALTRILAAELPALKVNATSPGWVRTEMGGRSAPRSVEQGAASVLFAVTLGPDGPTGGVFLDGQKVAP